MNTLNLRDAVRPFCPVHHWRMAYDSGSTKVADSYRCAHAKCTVHFTPGEGYFEAENLSDAADFHSRIENISCTHDSEHHPCVVGYAKESHAEQTVEWRSWKCSAEGCDFSTRQRLDSVEPVGHPSHEHTSAARQYAFAER